MDHDKTSQCTSLISDSEDELEYSDFGTENRRTWYTSEYGEGVFGHSGHSDSLFARPLRKKRQWLERSALKSYSEQRLGRR